MPVTGPPRSSARSCSIAVSASPRASTSTTPRSLAIQTPPSGSKPNVRHQPSSTARWGGSHVSLKPQAPRRKEPPRRGGPPLHPQPPAPKPQGAPTPPVTNPPNPQSPVSDPPNPQSPTPNPF